MLRIQGKARKLVAFALAGTLALQGAPTAAMALTSSELQAQLDVARTQLDELTNQTQAAGEDLHETEYALGVTTQQIADTEAQINEQQAQLEKAQETLGKRVAANYKSGTVSLLSIFLESSSFEELVNNIYYAGKVYQKDSEAIGAVKTLQAQLKQSKEDLEAQEAEQKRLVADKEVQVKELREQEAKQAAFVDHLDAEVAAKLEEERQAELERQRQEAAAAQAAAEAAAAAAAAAEAAAAQEAAAAAAAEAARQNQSAPVDNGSAGGTENGGGGRSENGGNSNSGGYYEVEPEPYNGGGGLSASQRSTIIAAAYSQLGTPYVYGGEEPFVGLDCSGFTQYCYGQAGVWLPHSAAAQSGEATATSLSNLQPGDLVFWIGTGNPNLSGNHVAIYLGDGMIIHANGRSVVTQSLYSGVTMYGYIS